MIIMMMMEMIIKIRKIEIEMEVSVVLQWNIGVYDCIYYLMRKKREYIMQKQEEGNEKEGNDNKGNANKALKK